MDCYECSIRAETTAASGFCTRCGVALCIDHLREAATYAVGGMRFGCPHHPDRASATRRVVDAPTLPRPHAEPTRVAR